MGKVWIDESAFFVQTAKLKKALPDDLKKAARVTQDSTRVVTQAQTEATRTIEDARAEAARLTGDAQSEATRLREESRANADRTLEDARSHSDRIVEDARREAERIVADANQQAEQIIAEHTITQRAQQFAEDTQQAALREADELRSQADNYAMDILNRTSVVLERLIDGVEQGKTQIQQAE
jgi:vacuolar-type H+-ATPase subunit H